MFTWITWPLLVVVFVSTWNFSEAVTCPNGWLDSTSSGTCIKVHHEKKNWNDARETCKEEGGDLVKIVNAAMDEFIWGIVSSDPEIQAHWIGLHDQKEEGVFKWLDETGDPGYTNWASGQPNDFDNGQDCTELGNPNFDMTFWNDDDCVLAAKFICEKKGKESPLTTTVLKPGDPGNSHQYLTVRCEFDASLTDMEKVTKLSMMSINKDNPEDEKTVATVKRNKVVYGLSKSTINATGVLRQPGEDGNSELEVTWLSSDGGFGEDFKCMVRGRDSRCKWLRPNKFASGPTWDDL